LYFQCFSHQQYIAKNALLCNPVASLDHHHLPGDALTLATSESILFDDKNHISIVTPVTDKNAENVEIEHNKFDFKYKIK